MFEMSALTRLRKRTEKAEGISYGKPRANLSKVRGVPTATGLEKSRL
jgi:hypothetical protein